jgi:transcriptional regulator with XRE-family HTH domain
MNETIGNRIAKFRKEKNMTQEELANLLGVSSQAVSKWENDASCPDISLLPQLSKVLGITADELLTGKNNEVRMVPPERRKPFDQLVMRVKVNSAGGDKVRVNLPMPMIKVCMEIGMNMLPNMGGEQAELFKNVDMSKLVQMVELGMTGKLVEVESADGDTVEILVE